MDVETYQSIHWSVNAAIKYTAKIISKICWKKEANVQTAKRSLILLRVKQLFEMLLQIMDQLIKQLKIVKFWLAVLKVALTLLPKPLSFLT
jgi:hypothetical protein